MFQGGVKGSTYDKGCALKGLWKDIKQQINNTFHSSSLVIGHVVNNYE